MPLEISTMRDAESEATARLIEDVITALPYYNVRAKREECAKYTAAELRALVATDADAVLLARADHDVVGFCISRYDDGLLLLSWFGVRPDCRAGGVGAALLAALARTLPARNAHKIWCDTRTENTRSQRVLQRAGFRRIGELTNHWYGQDFFLWAWEPG